MIDLGAMDYLLGVWYVPGDGCDLMAAIFRAKGESCYSMKYRFRYYSGSRNAFDESDRKNWYGGKFDPAMSEEQVIEAVEIVAGTFASAQHTEIDRVEVKGDPMSFIQKAAGRPWIHLRREPLQ